MRNDRKNIIVEKPSILHWKSLNIREAQNTESQADFIHKFKIAAKEADETEY
jgi:hypothetical protein